jgi:hypothetical protein
VVVPPVRMPGVLFTSPADLFDPPIANIGPTGLVVLRDGPGELTPECDVGGPGEIGQHVDRSPVDAV